MAWLDERLAEALPPGWTGQATVTARDAAERRDPATCRADFTAALAGTDLRFPAGGAVLTPAFYPTLDALAALAKTCPSLRIAVSGPADPAKPTPTPAAGPAATGEGAPAAAPTQIASAAKPEPPKPESSKPEPPKGDTPKTETPKGDTPKGDTPKTRGKPDHAKTEAGKAEAAKKDARKEPAAHGKASAKKPAEAPEEPPPDLPRLRAQAVVEYLLQAGARPEQVTAGPDGPAGPVVFALLP